MSVINLYATQPQLDFLQLQCKFPAFIGGLGSGKTHTLLTKAMTQIMQGKNIAIYEPTNKLLRLIIQPRIIEMLEQFGVTYHHDKQYNIILTGNGVGNIHLITMDNPNSLIGYQVDCSHVDELDTFKAVDAAEIWNKIIARNRPSMDVSVYTSPEGYKFCYEMWGKKWNDDYEAVHAPTHSNPFVGEEYVSILRNTYPTQLAEAYIEGKFVNLTSGTVFYNYDRNAHNSVETIQPKETLHVGMDFNVGKMAATIAVKRKDNEFHGVAEIYDLLDTPHMIQALCERYKNEGHHIIVYPDATGKNANAQNASSSASSIALLEAAHFEVRARPSNGKVVDGVQAVNKAYENFKLFINHRNCPRLAECQEKQAYDKNGDPDKTSGFDHMNDGWRYFVNYVMPIKRPIVENPFTVMGRY